MATKEINEVFDFCISCHFAQMVDEEGKCVYCRLKNIEQEEMVMEKKLNG